MKSELDWHNYVEERLSDYLDGQLSSDDSARVREHLQGCSRCQASLESLRWTVNLLHQVPAPALPRQFTLPVTQRVPVASAPGWWVWGLRGIAVAATAAFVVLLTLNLLQQPSASELMTSQAPAAAPTAVIAIAPSSAPAQPTRAPALSQGVATIPPMPSAPPPTLAPIPVTVTPSPEQPLQAAPSFAPEEPTETPPEPEPTNVPPSFNQAPQPTETPDSTMKMAVPSTESSGIEPSPTILVKRSTADLGPKIGLVKPFALTVRAGPNRQYRELGTLSRDDKVTITGRDKTGGWLEIEYLKNLPTGRGWVGASLIQTNVTISALPIVDAPPDEGLLRTATPSPTPTNTPTPTITSTGPASRSGQVSPTPTPIPPTPDAGSNGGTVTSVPSVDATERAPEPTETPRAGPSLKPTRSKPKP